MTGQELKNALLLKLPVEFNGIQYDYVSAIIYREQNGKIVVTAELMDKNSRSVTVAKSELVRKR